MPTVRMSCIRRTPERIERRNAGSARNRRSGSPPLSAADGGDPGRGCALLAIGFSGTRHSDSTSRSLSRRWMVSIAHKVPMYIVLLARRILNSHWAKTVTGTTPIGPSIEAHLYPWVFEEILSLSRSSLPFCLSLSLSLLFLSLSFSPLFAPCLPSSRRDEASIRFRRCIHTCVSTDASARENPRTPRIYMHDSLHFDSLALFLFLFTFPYSFLSSFDLHTCSCRFTTISYSFLFSEGKEQREKDRWRWEIEMKKKRSKIWRKVVSRKRGWVTSNGEYYPLALPFEKDEGMNKEE